MYYTADVVSVVSYNGVKVDRAPAWLGATSHLYVNENAFYRLYAPCPDRKHVWFLCVTSR